MAIFNLPGDNTSKTNNQDSTTVQTPDVPHLPLFHIEESLTTAPTFPSAHQHTSIPTSLVIPNNHVSNSLGSNINTLFSYIDRHCHSVYDEWSTPIIFPQYRDSNTFITISPASFQYNIREWTHQMSFNNLISPSMIIQL